MALTSTEVCEFLGVTTTNARITQIEKMLPQVIHFINEYTNGGFAVQAKEEALTIATTSTRQLTHVPVIEKSVYVTSTNRGTMYYGDALYGKLPIPTYYIPSTYVEDYVISYTTGGFNAVSTASGGRITPTTGVLVTYSYIDLVGGGKVAASRLVEQGYTQHGGIASESVGSLSRSYASMGMDEYTRKLLAPYKRVNFA